MNVLCAFHSSFSVKYTYTSVCMCVCLFTALILYLCVSILSEASDMAVGFQTGEENVQEPQAEEKKSRADPRNAWTPEFSSDRRFSPEHEHGHTDEGEDGVEGDGEG